MYKSTVIGLVPEHGPGMFVQEMSELSIPGRLASTADSRSQQHSDTYVWNPGGLAHKQCWSTISEADIALTVEKF